MILSGKLFLLLLSRGKVYFGNKIYTKQEDCHIGLFFSNKCLLALNMFTLSNGSCTLLSLWCWLAVEFVLAWRFSVFPGEGILRYTRKLFSIILNHQILKINKSGFLFSSLISFSLHWNVALHYIRELIIQQLCHSCFIYLGFDWNKM